MDSNELIHELKAELDNLPIEAPREVREELAGQIEDLEWREQVYNEKVSAFLALAMPRFEAKLARRKELRQKSAADDLTRRGERELEELERQRLDDHNPRHMLELSRHSDRQRRLTQWCIELRMINFLSLAEEQAIGSDIPQSPRYWEAIRAERARLDRIDKIFREILATIPAGWDRREALALWNIVGGEPSEEKISRWVEECRRKKFLDDRWLPARVLGSLWRFLFHHSDEKISGAFFK